MTNRKEYNRRYRQLHRAEILQKKKDYRRNNREKISASNRRRRYQISQEEFDRIFESQGKRCRGCWSQTPGGRGTWHVDHDAKTGLVRGILCSKCNLAIGLLNHDVWTLINLIDHLEEFERTKTERCVQRAIEQGGYCPF